MLPQGLNKPRALQQEKGKFRPEAPPCSISALGGTTNTKFSTRSWLLIYRRRQLSSGQSSAAVGKGRAAAAVGISPVRTVGPSCWAWSEYSLAYKEQLVAPERHIALPPPSGPKTLQHPGRRKEWAVCSLSVTPLESF